MRRAAHGEVVELVEEPEVEYVVEFLSSDDVKFFCMLWVFIQEVTEGAFCDVISSPDDRIL